MQEKFLVPLQITPYRLAKETKIPQTRISEIIKKNRRITADTALRLASSLETLQNSGWDYRMILKLN